MMYTQLFIYSREAWLHDVCLVDLAERAFYREDYTTPEILPTHPLRLMYNAVGLGDSYMGLPTAHQVGLHVFNWMCERTAFDLALYDPNFGRHRYRPTVQFPHPPRWIGRATVTEPTVLGTLGLLTEEELFQAAYRAYARDCFDADSRPNPVHACGLDVRDWRIDHPVHGA